MSLLAIFLLTVLTGYFVAQEFSFVAADRSALREQAAGGDAKAEKALRVTGRLSFMLSGAQLGITVTTLLVGFLAEPGIAAAIRPALGFLPPAAVSGVALAIGVALATLLQMILGELAPKNLGIARPEAVAKVLAPSTLAYLTVAGPLIKLFDASATRLVRLFGIEPVEELEEGATPEELSRIVADSAAAGELPPRLAELLERALEFGDRAAEDVMVPRIRVVSISAAASVDDLLDVVRAKGHSRYPVLGDDDQDDVVGVVGLMELIRAGDGRARVGDLAKAPLLVPTTLGLPALLERMRASGDDFACVIDEYGGLAGVVTGEDLAEELVGELVDENDPEPLGVVVNGAGRWDVPGTLRLDEVARATGVRLPESEDYETIAGLVLASLGRLAEPGEMTTVPVIDEPGLLDDDREPQVALITVLKVERHVPALVRLTLGEPDPAGHEEEWPQAATDYAPGLFSALFQGGVA
ncbi:HlyC/CorC family transporter [Streptosporangiaceae bacterium NEAU-GS5]|nr:HlyC/CorC family transporter [Streptosporangiaceae bacterium NEAU-GS5]